MKLKQFEDQVVTLDAGCAERSCACYSPQFGDTDGVPYYPESVVRQQQEEIVKLKLEWQYMYDRANMESTSEHDLGIAEAIGFEKGHKSAEDKLRQQQERLTKYELRHIVQRDRIAILEAQLKKAQEK